MVDPGRVRHSCEVDPAQPPCEAASAEPSPCWWYPVCKISALLGWGQGWGERRARSAPTSAAWSISFQPGFHVPCPPGPGTHLWLHGAHRSLPSSPAVSSPLFTVLFLLSVVERTWEWEPGRGGDSHLARSPISTRCVAQGRPLPFRFPQLGKGGGGAPVEGGA